MDQKQWLADQSQNRSVAKPENTRPMTIDPCRENRTTASIVLVDDATNEPVAAGTVV